MGCPNAVKLADFQAGRLDGKARGLVEAHLQDCAACRTSHARVSGALMTLREIGGSRTPTPTSVSAARMEATLRWTKQYPAMRPSAPRWSFGLAVAAAAALAGVVGWKVWQARVRHPEAPVVAVRPAPAPALVPQAPERSALEAVVTLLGGDARLDRGSSSTALQAQARLGAGDGLTTQAGARIGIQWDEGSGALIGAASELKLARLESRAQDLELRRGRVSVRVGKHRPGESLQVIAPDHVVTVHGTWFNVIQEARGTTVEVMEGVVEVSARDGDRSSTRLAAPQRAFFPRGAGVGEGARALSGREAEKLRQMSDMALLGWTGVDELLGGTGTLDLQPNPVAAIAVDGVAFGSTPLVLRRPIGRHLVELSRPGFATVSRWVTVGEESSVLRLELKQKVGKPEVAETPDEAFEIARLHERKLAACFERVAKRDPDMSGDLSLQIHVGAEGQVLGTTLERNTWPDDYVARCVKEVVRGWTFAQSRNVNFSLPIGLKPRK